MQWPRHQGNEASWKEVTMGWKGVEVDRFELEPEVRGDFSAVFSKVGQGYLLRIWEENNEHF